MSLLIFAPQGIAIKPLCRVFEHSGLTYELCSDENQCLEKARTNKHVVFLVIHTGNFPNLLAFHAKWKETESKAAFIVLTPRQSGAERVQALHAGINSYHITPFSYTQLVRDVAQYEYIEQPTTHIIEASGFSADVISRSVKFKGQHLPLTRKQYEFMVLLMRNQGHVFSRVQIWERVWPNGEYPLANTVDVHVNRLRKKLPPEARKLIETVYGFGYRLRDPEDK